MKQLPKHPRILRRPLGPHIPQVISERIRNKLIMLVLLRIILRWRRLRVGVISRIQLLRGQETEVLAPQVATERSSVATRFVRQAVHGALDDLGVFHHDGDFAVMVPDLRAIVDVGAAADGPAVVDDEEFAVDVELLLDPEVGLLLVVAFPCFRGEAGLAEHGVLGDAGCVSGNN